MGTVDCLVMGFIVAVIIGSLNLNVKQVLKMFVGIIVLGLFFLVAIASLSQH